MGHKNEATPSRNEMWMVNELPAPQVVYRREVRVLEKVNEPQMVYWVRRILRDIQHQLNGRKEVSEVHGQTATVAG